MTQIQKDKTGLFLSFLFKNDFTGTLVRLRPSS